MSQKLEFCKNQSRNTFTKSDQMNSYLKNENPLKCRDVCFWVKLPDYRSASLNNEWNKNNKRKVSNIMKQSVSKVSKTYI